MNEVIVKPKRFIAIPRDAFECLAQRHATEAEAIDSGKDSCAEDGMTVYIVELKAVVARADKPVTVKKL